MAGSIEVTEDDLGSGLTHYIIAWTSDAAGAVSGNNFYMKPGSLRMYGFSPGAGGVQPTSLYDVTVPCVDHAVDIVGGGGANLSNTAATHTASLSWIHGGLFTLTVANAGNAKEGVVEFWIDKA